MNNPWTVNRQAYFYDRPNILLVHIGVKIIYQEYNIYGILIEEVDLSWIFRIISFVQSERATI